MNRKKRFAVMAAVVLITAAMLSMSVFAAGDSDGFSLWDLLDGLGGFFRDLINYVGRFIANVISAIRNGVNAVLDGIVKIIKAIGGAVSSLLSGLKTLFVPSKEAFATFRDDILLKFDKKFGSVFSALNYLNTRFKGLSAKSDLREVFKITFPKSSFLSGLSINFLSILSPLLAFVRFVLTGICCLMTALTCYHKVIEMVNT